MKEDELVRDWFFSHPELLDPETMASEVRIRLWRKPSSGVWRHWVVLESKGKERVPTWFVRMATRKRGAAPTSKEMQTRIRSERGDALSLGLHEAIAPALEIRRLFSDLASIVVSVRGERVCGLDGIACGVEFLSEGTTSHFAWWGSGPRQWADLIRWYDRAVEVMQLLFVG